MVLPQPSIAQLRPALKLALDRAKSGSPAQTLPGRVRSLVRSRRLPASWAVTMAQVLDDDDAFRSWVAEAASEEDLGRVAWLWLVRPEGWADEAASLIEVDAAAEEMDKEVRLAAERAESLERELAAVRDELERARADQSAIAAEADEQRRTAARLQVELRADLASALEAERQRAAGLRAAHDALRIERDTLAARADELESRLAGSERARAEAEAERARLAAEMEALVRDRDAVRREAEGRRVTVGGAVQRAAAAAGELGAALAAAAAALGAAPPARPGDAAVATPPPEHDPAPDPALAAVRTPPPPGRIGRPARRSARRPVHLPLGVFDDSPEAAAYLVKVPGAHLVVDGYNVALTSWGEPGSGRAASRDLPALRRRLLNALGELAVRVQRAVTVVFDGRDEGGRMAATGAARPWLRIVFSASSVEADEVILEAVGELRPEVPVVVATNDREVRDGARSLGANVISVDQLLTVLNRHTSM